MAYIFLLYSFYFKGKIDACMFSKFKYLTAALLSYWRQHGRVVSASDSQSGGLGFSIPSLATAGFVLVRSKFKCSAKWLPPASLGFLILLCWI